MNVSMNELKAYAEEFLNKNYSIGLSSDIAINGRLSRAMGRFVVTKRFDHVETRVELSKRLVKHNDKETIFAVLKHELIHYAHYHTGLPVDDDSEEFISACNRLGAPLTETFSMKQPMHQYRCDCHVHQRARKIRNFHVGSHCCDKCKAVLEYVGIEIL